MHLFTLLSRLLTDSTVAEVVSAAQSRVRTDRVTVAAPGVRPALLAAMTLGEGGCQTPGGEPQSSATGPALLVVTATTNDAEQLRSALLSYLPEHDVAIFPAWETLPHERLSPQADTIATRLSVLRRLAHPEDGQATSDHPADPSRGPIRVLIVPVRALLAPIIAGLGDLTPVTVRPGPSMGLEALVEYLSRSAYTRVDLVDRRGEFAVRGGILDVFPPTEPRPIRVDFFGDDIESVSSFSVSDQRTIEEVGPVTITACRELLLTPAVRDRAAALVDVIPGAAPLLSSLAEGIPMEGMESLAPVLADGMTPLLELVGDRLAVVVEPEKVRRRAEDLESTTAEFLAAAWTSASSGGEIPVDLSAAAFAPLSRVRSTALAQGMGWWSLSSFAPNDDAAHVAATDSPEFRGQISQAVSHLGQAAARGWLVCITTGGPGPARRMVELLSDGDVPARILTGSAELVDAVDHPNGVVRVLPLPSFHSFSDEAARVLLIRESDITGRAPRSSGQRRALPARRSRRSVDPLSLHPGDLVVHASHGVGRFVELLRRPVGGPRSNATREYVVIEYAPSKRGQPGDRLLVPTDALDQLTKYVGSDNPSLNKMGGADWKKTKARARSAVRNIAGELVRLYAARAATQGHAYAPDTPWQAELEESFAFTETPDQLTTIDEVKADMEKPQPMDRLICGDVGYGKTEIAVRAAFKAIQDGKQVAVLVPTTLLVSQHAETFTERYAGFPVTVAQLSRFQSPAESKAVLEGLAAGSIDVVVGTHRLITGQVRFKDLGLVIIDEEQRFGVEHKETLKALRANVDVLSMSATPIPRTLEMAVTGLREMSTLATPPEDRHPILTYVGAYEAKQVGAAIRRELLRDGQVFYVHNRVEDIDKVAAQLADMVPQARVAVAHGQMGEARLEAIIDDFWHKEIDVLVCTTIVETGLDVSNANTLIVDRADRMGLSQLHQLRGRVGRGRERAYAYFLYPADKTLTDTALERLRTIATHTDLGAGMQVAMKDLEIRGAGNLLGGEQSGHIAGVGFDLYVRMVAEAVEKHKRALRAAGDSSVPAGDAEDAVEDEERRVELPIEATIPEDYISSERLRLEAYTKFAAARSDEQVEEILAELADRYGPVPQPVQHVAAIARLRALAAELGVREIVAQGKSVRFAPVVLPESGRMKLTRIYPGTILKPATRTVVVPAPGSRKMGGGAVDGVDIVRWAEVFLRSIVQGDSSYDVEATTHRVR